MASCYQGLYPKELHERIRVSQLGLSEFGNIPSCRSSDAIVSQIRDAQTMEEALGDSGSC